MNLCFDFDGPLIDVQDRYYRAYLESLADSRISKEQILSKEDFWRLKQNRVTDLEIGLLSSLSLNESKSSAEIRKDLSFKHEYLALDRLFDDVYEVLDYLKLQNITFFVVTLRRKKQLQHAIKQFKLEKHLSSERLFAINDDQKIVNDIQDKYIEVVNAINKLHLNSLETWIIGDADTDIHVAKLARCSKVISISRGIRSKEQLELLKPNHLISSLTEIIPIIERLKQVAKN